MRNPFAPPAVLALLAGLVFSTPARAQVCRGQVHVVVRDENGRILDPARLDAIDATPAAVIEPLPLALEKRDYAPHRENTLRLGGCAFEGDVLLSLRRRRMVLRFRNMKDLNDVPFVIDAPPFQGGAFELDFTTVSGPLVPSTLWRPVAAEVPTEEWVAAHDRAFVEAWRLRDTRALDPLIAGDAFFSEADGGRRSRTEWLQQVSARSAEITAVVYDTALRVVREPGLAVVNGTLRFATARAAPETQWRFTRVYVNREGEWLLIADHETAAPQRSSR